MPCGREGPPSDREIEVYVLPTEMKPTFSNVPCDEDANNIAEESFADSGRNGRRTSPRDSLLENCSLVSFPRQENPPMSQDSECSNFARGAFLARLAVFVAASVDQLRGRVPWPFPGDDSVVAVGRCYLAAHSHEADVSFLQRMLRAGHLASVRARTRRDFSLADVVVIDGWIITRTEARICALASLTARDAD
jgi:hypothetical protein